MARRQTPMPTDAELAILKILWAGGGMTVRDVHEQLEPARPTRYTTTLKQLQVMVDKGLVTRDETQRSHIYKPAVRERDTLGRIARDVLARAFDGSAQKLIMHAIEGRAATADELAKIRAMLDEVEKGGGR